MSRNITVIGTGYVGLVAAVGLADFGNTLIGVDIDKEKVNQLNNGNPVIYEVGIKEYLLKNIKSKRLTFTSDIGSAIKKSEVILIAVGTPSKEDGSVDLSQIEAVADSIAQNLNDFKVIVTKSTVPVGTNRWLKRRIEELSGNKKIDIVSNPEFLREGKALHDFFHPDKVVIGYESEKIIDYIEDIYRTLYLIQTPFVWCNLETAELIKYAGNTYLATKITFINQMANLSEAVGADIHVIAKALGMDGRISPKFLHPGPGYGGSCFPKDTKGILHIAKSKGIDLTLIKEVIQANEKQKYRMAEKLKRLIGELDGKTIAVLGLAFKAETDDVRESPSLKILGKLLEEGANVRAHDPKALDNFRKIFSQSSSIEYCENEFDTIRNADAIMILTEWNEYRNLDLERVKKEMRGNIIIDTRNVLDREYARSLGFVYEGMGR